MADHDVSADPGAAEAPLRRVRPRRSMKPKLVWLIAGGVAVVVLVVSAATFWLNKPEVDAPTTVTVQDTQQIREFLDGLDTLVPGEHVVSLSEVNLHFIVDGIDETK